MLRVTGQTTAIERDACTRRVCVGIVRHSSRLHYYAFRPNETSEARFANLTDDEEALSIAIGYGDRTIIDQLIQSGVPIYAKTFLFDDVLTSAIANYRKGALVALLIASGPAPDGRTRGSQKRKIDVHITTAIESRRKTRNMDTVVELMSWYDFNPETSPFKSSVTLFEQCLMMRDATKEDTVKLFDAIFALNPPAKT